MSKEGGPSERDLDFEAKQTISQADLIRGGAKFVRTQKSDEGTIHSSRLEVTEQQEDDARREMEYALEAPNKLRSLMRSLEGIKDGEELTVYQAREMYDAAYLAKEANEKNIANTLFRRLAQNMQHKINNAGNNPNDLKNLLEDQLLYLSETDDHEAVDAVKQRLEQVLKQLREV